MEVSRCIVYWHLLVFAFWCTSGIQAQTVIGPDPEREALLIGTTHTLTCRKEPADASGSVLWEEEGDPRKTLFINDGREDLNPKYDNFAIDEQNLYDLVITNIAIEDEGTYACRYPATATEFLAVRSVEVQATSCDMSQNGSDINTAIVTAGEPTNVVCTALGARPVVNIEWYHQMEGESGYTMITTGVTQTEEDNLDGTYNTIGTLQYTASKDYNEGRLRCLTTGQEVAEPWDVSVPLNVQYAPEVSLSFNDPVVYCSSNANPVVKVGGYFIIVNEADEYQPDCTDNRCTLTLAISEDTPVRCNATNDFGTGTATIIAVPGATTPDPPTTTPIRGSTTKPSAPVSGLSTGAIAGIAIGVIILITIIIVLLVYFLVIKKKKDKNKPTNSGIPMKSSNGSGDKPKERPTPAPRNSQGDAKPYHDNDAAKKPPANDNPDGITYAALEHGNSRPASTNKIIRTEEPTEYADVKTFIRPESPP